MDTDTCSIKTILKEKGRKGEEKKRSISLYSPVIAGPERHLYSILPEENANHQSQAACYVSV